MIKVGVMIMTVLLPLLCCGCGSQSGIVYGSRIELDAGSDRGDGSGIKADEGGLFFSGRFGRIQLGR